jgi:hypothetical protein
MLNRSRIVALLAFSAVFSVLVSAPAFSQKPALTQNIDEKGRVPYQDTETKLCTNMGNVDCGLTFAAVPSGYRLVVTYVSAFFYLNSPSNPYFIGLDGGYSLPNGTQQSTAILIPTAIGGNGYAVSSPLTYYIDQGYSPSFDAPGAAVGKYVVGTVTGYLINLSQ